MFILEPKCVWHNSEKGDLLVENVFYCVTLFARQLWGVFILEPKCVAQFWGGDLLVENVFYDPLRLDGEKPLCDESGDISPQDSNSKVLRQIIFKFTKLSSNLPIIHNYYLPISPQDSNSKDLHNFSTERKEILNWGKRKSQQGENSLNQGKRNSPWKEKNFSTEGKIFPTEGKLILN